MHAIGQFVWLPWQMNFVSKKQMITRKSSEKYEFTTGFSVCVRRRPRLIAADKDEEKSKEKYITFNEKVILLKDK